jgi:hypothetical protein
VRRSTFSLLWETAAPKRHFNGDGVAPHLRSPFRRSTTAATLSREASRSIGSIAFKRRLHATEIALREGILLDPKLQNAHAIVVPGEEGIIAMKLEQKNVVPVFLWRILHGRAMAKYLMDRHAEGSLARRGPMISSCEVLYVFSRGLSESRLALLRQQFDIVGYRLCDIIRKLKIVVLDVFF